MVDQEPGANQNMKHFTSIEKIDTGILYALELTSSISKYTSGFRSGEDYASRREDT